MGELKGFVKNGLDSSVIINIIVVFGPEFNEFERKGFSFPPNLFYSHEISRYKEVKGILINKYGFSKGEAEKAFENFKEKFNVTEIKRIKDVDKKYEDLAEDANKRVIKKKNNPHLKIGDEDIIIIGGFSRENVNIIHSADNGFLETCKELKFDILPLPKRDIERENRLKKKLNK